MRTVGSLPDYHLLIATTQVSDGGLAMLGLRPGDIFGSEALARRMHAQTPEDSAAPDLGTIMARSAANVRSASGGRSFPPTSRARGR
ncbi:hypothetical protein [Kribbella sp.]|uniref:hypothetical protein n=1 Tax=Kribbella sp. TaxID=1871183 RepID=UPI002D5E13E7|nr:hypothetical protein [Kribbella sp.]HZX07896.1 hypothetical protein [Kribbella sp.]